MIRFIVHGGMGQSAKDKKQKQKRLTEMAGDFRKRLTGKEGAVSLATDLVSALEDDPLFNAGTGSRIQRDGKIRMTASIMDSEKLSFASVINIQNIRNPIQVARRLLEEENSVVTAQDADITATYRLPKHDPFIRERLKDYNQKRGTQTGTVGAVVLDEKGVICAATSTGGRGYEFPGRVSDVASPVGNYVSGAVGVSCTGNGEKIRDMAAGSSLVVLREQGWNLKKAIRVVFDKLEQQKGLCGIIGIDREKGIFHHDNSGMMVFASGKHQ